MSQPSPESRISNLEKESMTLGARIEELATDTDNNFRALRQEMKDGFLQMGRLFDLNAGNIEGVKTTLETRLDRIEATQEQILKLLQQK